MPLMEELDMEDYNEEVELDEAKKKTKDFLKDLKTGSLHKDLGVPLDKPIPADKLDKATHSKDPLIKKRAILAKNMRSWNRGGKKR